MEITILGSTGIVAVLSTVEPPQTGRCFATRIENEVSSWSISVDEKSLRNLKVSVDDLAEFILQQISSKERIKKATLISSGKN